MPKKALLFLLAFPVVGIIAQTVDYVRLRRKISLLTNFKKTYTKWLGTIGKLDTFHTDKGNPELRSEVVALIPHVTKALDGLGRGRAMRIPPAAFGGPVLPISLIEECVNLDMQAWGSGIPQKVVDEVDKAASEYHTKSKIAFRNVFNPVYWIVRTVVFFVRIPFVVFEAAGFEQRSRKIESSIWGKLIKLAIVILAVLADLHTLGFLKSTWDFAKELMERFA